MSYGPYFSAPDRVSKENDNHKQGFSTLARRERTFKHVESTIKTWLLREIYVSATYRQNIPRQIGPDPPPGHLSPKSRISYKIPVMILKLPTKYQ